MKKILFCIMVLLMGSLCLHVFAEDFSIIVKENTLKYENVDTNKFATFFENGIFAIKERKLFLVNSWRNRGAAYLYGCSDSGQLKAYVDYTLKKGVLDIIIKVTYDGPEAEAQSMAEETVKSITSVLEKYINIPTVRVLNAVAFREGPAVKEKRIRFLQSGEVLELIEKKDSWFKLRTLKEPKEEGWVFGNNLQQR